MTDYSVSAPKVTATQAAIFMRHHAELAQTYYEACDDMELEELLKDASPPVQQFFQVLQAFYEEMNDGG